MYVTEFSLRIWIELLEHFMQKQIPPYPESPGSLNLNFIYTIY